MSESFDKWFWSNIAKLDDPIEDEEKDCQEIMDRPIVKKKKKRQRYINNKGRHR